MSGDALIEGLGFLGALGSASIAVPQAVRAVRQPTAGVSPMTYQLIVLVGGIWVGYGFNQSLIALLAGNVVLLSCGVVVLACCRRDGHKISELVPGAAAGATLGAVLVFVGDASWLGWYAGFISFVMRLPQLRRAIWDPDISGISINTWVLAFATNTTWLIYGILVGDVRLIVAGAAVTPISASIIAVVYYRRRALHQKDLATQ